MVAEPYGSTLRTFLLSAFVKIKIDLICRPLCCHRRQSALVKCDLNTASCHENLRCRIHHANLYHALLPLHIRAKQTSKTSVWLKETRGAGHILSTYTEITFSASNQLYNWCCQAGWLAARFLIRITRHKKKYADATNAGLQPKFT